MRKLTYANVASTLALLVALSGAAYASANLEPNSVATKHLKDEAVTTGKLDNNSVTGAKIKKGTVKPSDLGFNAEDIEGYELVYSGNETAEAGETEQSFAQCPAGKVPIGGGWFSSSYEIRVSSNRPEITSEARQWVVDLWNQSSGQITVGAWAACAKGTAPTMAP